MLSARFILAFPCVLLAITVPGWGKDHTLQTGSEVASANSGAGSLISKPGVVAVDAQARRLELTDAYALDLCTSSTSPPESDLLLHDLKAPADYGLDKRYLDVSSYYRKAASACLRGHDASCTNIQQFALDWAQASKLGRPKGNKDQSLFWNETLSINMRLLSPMMSALGVAEQFSPLTESDRKILDPWLKRKVDQFEHGMRNEGNYKGGKHGTTARRAAHNHAIQSSIVAMSYGAWVNDEKYFKTGIEQWRITLKSMRKDGSLPVETRRGARALFYTGRTIAALMQLVERAAVQGIDLNDSAPRRHQTIHNAVTYFIDTVEQPDMVIKYARTNHAPGPSKNYKIQYLDGKAPFGWIHPYMARFPDHSNTRRLLSRRHTGHSEPRSYLTDELDKAIRSRNSSEWIGVDATCFYANPEFI